MRPTAASTGTCSAAPRNASRGGSATSLRSDAARRHDRRGRARLGEPLDGLLDVAGEPPQRRHGLPEPDDEHDRRLHRQLDVDVVGAAQRVGDLVAGAAGAAHVEHDPQRVVGRDAHLPDQRRVDERDARRSSPASRARPRSPRASRAAAARRAARAGGGRRRATRAAATTGSWSAAAAARGRSRRRRSGRCRRRAASRSASASRRSCACS